MRNVIKLTIILFITMSFISCKTKWLDSKENEKLVYSLINYHFSNIDTIRLISNTGILNKDLVISDVGENSLTDQNYYEILCYRHGNVTDLDEEMNSMFTSSEKELINKGFSNLSKRVKLRKNNLDSSILVIDGVKGWTIGYEQVTYPFSISSNGVEYFFFIEGHSNGGGHNYIYKREDERWIKILETPLWFS